MSGRGQPVLAPRSYTRRQVLIAGGVLAASAVRPAIGGTHAAAQAPSGTGPAGADPWSEVPAIRARIRPPTFGDRIFDITRFGAVSDGRTLCTRAFASAVAECHQAGGGRVHVPAGVFLTGAIHLLSGVELHVADGATVKFSTEPKHYLPLMLTRWEGTECYSYSPFIYAHGQTNVGITGGGVLDGQGSSAPWSGWRAQADVHGLRRMANAGVPVEQRRFGPGHTLRPSMIQLYQCRNVLVAGLRIRNPAMWALHPVLSQGITIRHVTVHGAAAQGDGCVLDSCADARVADCRFDTSSDGVAIKSGRDADGHRVGVPTRNVLVERCAFSGSGSAVAVGSEMSGGVDRVFVRDCVVNPVHGAGPSRVKHALYVKTNNERGGYIRGVYLRDITGRQLRREAVHITMYYQGGGPERVFPSVRDIRVEGAAIDGALAAVHVAGRPESPVQQVRIENGRFASIAEPNTISHADVAFANVTINGVPAR